MTNEMIALKCTSCGKEIKIPAELSDFSCLYCGAKLCMADFFEPTQPADEADRAFAEAHILDCIRNFPEAYRQFNRKKYDAVFAANRDCLAPAFEAMDRWVCAQPARREELLEEFVGSFLTQWEEYHQSHKKSRSRRARLRLEFESKLTLAWYSVPAIQSLGLSVSEDFPPLLRDRFNARYPDNRFEIASYQDISSGFRRSLFWK